MEEEKHPLELIGEPVEPEHDLDLTLFEIDDSDDEEEDET